MIWLDLLRRLWPYLTGLALIIGSALYLHHAGYKSGYAASEAKWQPALASAQRELDAANARTEKTEADSKALTDQIETQHAQTVASLNLRAADAQRRYAELLRQYSADPGGGNVPQDGRATGNADAASPSDQRDERASRDFARLARRCESDAATLTDLQHWVTEQRAIINQ